MDKECGHPAHPDDGFDPSLPCFDCYMIDQERTIDLIEGEYDHGTYDYIYEDED